MNGLTRNTSKTVDPRIEVRLRNFRLFRDTGWIPLDPLMCILGRNSSGKSSFVFALLLLKQSVEKRVFGSVVTPLSLSGDYCDLGQFRDLAHDHNKSTTVTYSFRIPVSLIPTHSRDDTASPIVTLLPKGAIWSEWLRYIGGDLHRAYKRHEVIELSLTFSEDEPFGPSLSRCEIMAPRIGRVRFIRTISGERKQHWRTYSRGFPQFSQFGLEQDSSRFFPQLRWKKSSDSGPGIGRDKDLIAFHRTFTVCFEMLENLLRGSEMIGPFRQPPERRYAFSGFGTNKIGPSGEQAIDLLITELLIRKGGSKPLISAVGYWLKALKLAESIKVKDAAKKLNLFEIDLRLSGGRQLNNLVDVGFGISQVLPVLVQGLLMTPGGIYFVQEPEIHLHPDAQAALADFFIYLTSRGVRCIVETHSEYLVLRLRRRLAEGKAPLASALPRSPGPTKRLTERDISVFVSQSAGNEAKITKLEIGKNFQFSNMPQGFMSQATEDRMELLKAVSKRDA